MVDFQFYVPTKIGFGRGAELKAGAYVREYGKTVLPHFGKGPAGFLKKLCKEEVIAIYRLALA